MYYWDGQRWVSTLSPDGRHRWNGTAWVPAPQSVYPAQQYTAQQARESTSWTRPLQIAVIARYGLTGVYAVMVPFLMGGYMTQVVQQSIQRQQQAYPPGATPPPGFAEMMSSIMTGSLWVGALIGAALSIVAIVAAIKRWVWAYYVILVLLGFTLAGSVFNLINLAVGGALTASQPQPPEFTRVVAYIFTPIDVLLFVWMLVAVIRRGPWAMRRVSY
jgi:hypothetical protein